MRMGAMPTREDPERSAYLGRGKVQVLREARLGIKANSYSSDYEIPNPCGVECRQ